MYVYHSYYIEAYKAFYDNSLELHPDIHTYIHICTYVTYILMSGGNALMVALISLT